MSNLYCRQITPSNKCELCQLCPEDLLHALWSCKDVENVWSSFHYFHQSSSPQPSNFSDLLSRFLQVQEDYGKKVFAISAWFLWNRRNTIHFGRPVHPTTNIISLAGNMLQDFLVAHDLDPMVYRSPILQQWCPTELNQHKVNFDSAIFRGTNSAGIGVVARDRRAELVGALSASIPLSQAVADMEALACPKVVEFAAEIGLQRVIFEEDSTMVINALNHGSIGFSSYGVVIEDIHCQAVVF